jgi:hypothetical protein
VLDKKNGQTADEKNRQFLFHETATNTQPNYAKKGIHSFELLAKSKQHFFLKDDFFTQS